MTKFIIDSDEVFTVEEAADKLGLSRATMFKYLRDGKVIPLKIQGRTLITRGEIDRVNKVMELNGARE